MPLIDSCTSRRWFDSNWTTRTNQFRLTRKTKQIFEQLSICWWWEEIRKSFRFGSELCEINSWRKQRKTIAIQNREIKLRTIIKSTLNEFDQHRLLDRAKTEETIERLIYRNENKIFIVFCVNFIIHIFFSSSLFPTFFLVLVQSSWSILLCFVCANGQQMSCCEIRKCEFNNVRWWWAHTSTGSYTPLILTPRRKRIDQEHRLCYI